MKTKKILLQSGALALTLLAANVMAAVSPEEAAKLGTTLTPIGAEKAGNTDGTIPEWTGGLPTNAGEVDSKGFLADPFPDEKPQFIITAQNVEQYKDKLTPGQQAMFKRYPDTYKIPVFPTHRSAALPDAMYEAAKANAVNTTLVENGNGLANYQKSVPFPIPKSGLEVIWNHITHYRGGSATRSSVMATPQANGAYTLIQFKEHITFNYALTDYDPNKNGNVIFYFKQKVIAPARLSGNVLLVHETLNQVKEPRMAWLYSAGQRRVRRAPQVAYDGPAQASDGLRTTDNSDMFSGSPDRYEWTLNGKKEIYIPYNSYRLGSPKLKYDQIIKKGHINQDLTRYELHRVWHVTATLKSGERHIYAKRDFYIDEDSWAIAEADHYDGRGALWRVAEAHALHYYNNKVPFYIVEPIYDLVSGRYLVFGLNNETDDGFTVGVKASSGEFTPTSLRQSGVQ